LRRIFAGALVWTTLLATGASAACLDCHERQRLSAADAHAFLDDHCSACHLGDASATDAEQAHRDMVVSPGQSADARSTCAACHTPQAETVLSSLMHSGRGIVNVTRFTFGEQSLPEGDGDLSRLGHNPADSVLRKLCASCHLGQPLHQIETVQPIGTRGGGCLACHLPHASGAGHPALTARVGDEQCVGCHSRSGRVALNYAGLAEVDDEALRAPDTSRLGYLEDGRLVERLPADVHHRAGLACVDCHTVRDLMGPTGGFMHGSEAVDIQCRDCHENDRPRIRLADWPADLIPLRQRIPFPVNEEQRFLTTERRGTPLWHVEVTPNGNRLHRKIHGGWVAIPPLSTQHHPEDGAHGRVTCSACHSQWAPQCYGCHMSYDPAGEQWDHLEREITPGHWHDRRWDVRNGPPPLGVDARGQIVAFVPGMIRSVAHPDWDEPRFRRLFAPVSPHTVGPARDCEECHRSSTALGLGEGLLAVQEGRWTFAPAHPLLEDGLPEDSFVTLDGRQAETTRSGARGFTPDELQRVLNAPASPSLAR
jgi:predicted CXXCH cytochrome family protein